MSRKRCYNTRSSLHLSFFDTLNLKTLKIRFEKCKKIRCCDLYFLNSKFFNFIIDNSYKSGIMELVNHWEGALNHLEISSIKYMILYGIIS